MTLAGGPMVALAYLEITVKVNPRPANIFVLKMSSAYSRVVNLGTTTKLC